MEHTLIEHPSPDDLYKIHSCPLCAGSTLMEKHALLSHIAKHLEEISLTALPLEIEIEASDENEASDETEGFSKLESIGRHLEDRERHIQTLYATGPRMNDDPKALSAIADCNNQMQENHPQKVLHVLGIDPIKRGGKPVASGIEEEMKKFVTQAAENRWRCKVPDCSKLFKEQYFWRKHVDLRHKDFCDKIKQDVSLQQLAFRKVSDSRTEIRWTGKHRRSGNFFRAKTPLCQSPM